VTNAWLRRIFGNNCGAWKTYLANILQEQGGLFVFLAITTLEMLT